MNVTEKTRYLNALGATSAAIRGMRGLPLPAVVSAPAPPSPAAKTDKQIADEAVAMSRAEGISVVDALKRMGITTWPRAKASR